MNVTHNLTFTSYYHLKDVLKTRHLTTPQVSVFFCMELDVTDSTITSNFFTSTYKFKGTQRKIADNLWVCMHEMHSETLYGSYQSSGFLL